VLAYPYNTICKFKVEEGNAASVVGENFAIGFVAGSLAVDDTCPDNTIEICIISYVIYTFIPFVFNCYQLHVLA
jgi:hypothetical protein